MVQLHGQRHGPFGLLSLFLWLCLTIAQDPGDSLSFEDAVVHEAEVQVEMAAANVTNTIQFPPDIAESFNITEGFDQRILQLAELVPAALPQFEAPAFSRALSDITPPAGNDTEGQIERRQGRMRVLVVGDSISHCNDGDFTWRYRLWQWFRAQGIAMEYVGPYRGTAAPPPPGPPQRIPNRDEGELRPQPNFNGNYAREASQAAFEGWHFAVSGRSVSVNRGLIENVVRDARPNMMLIELGFNDLGWYFSDESGLLRNMKTMIDNARRAQPNMRIVVATVPHRTFIGGRQDLVRMTDNYNRLLKDQISGWATATSPITWAPFREEFDCGPQYGKNCPASYDGLHPNEVGDYQIARAFSRALVSSFGIGSEPLAVRFDQFRSLPAPSGLQISSSPLGATATWDKIFGAYGYDVDYTINGGAYFQFSPGDVKTNRWDTRWAQDGWEYRIRVRAHTGDRKGPWSGWVSAIARPELPSVIRPEVDPTPQGFQVRLLGGGGDNDPDNGSINGYYVYFWDKTDNCAFLLVAAFPTSPETVYFTEQHGIKLGHKYWIAAAGLNDNGEGFPAVGRTVIAGNTDRPGQPQNYQLQAYSNGAGIHATWNSAANAGSYIFRRSNVGTGPDSANTTIGESDTGCIDSSFEFPGTWTYRYTVYPTNGEALGPPVALDGPQGAESSARCPPAPEWCPPGSGGGPPALDPVDPSDPPPASGEPPQPEGPPDPFLWAAMGDSFSAGPGSGSLWDPEDPAPRCTRNNGSYAAQLESSFPYPNNHPDLQFTACTGDVSRQVRENQIYMIDPDTEAVLLSIGGNDLGFGDIVRACFYKLLPGRDSCNPAIAAARAMLESGDFERALVNTWEAIYSRLRPERGFRRPLYLTFYPHFFGPASTGDWCHINSFGPFFHQSITKELRDRLNQLSFDVTDKMVDVAKAFHERKNRDDWDVNRFYGIDVESRMYDGHRFCEPRTASGREWNLEGTNVWFHTQDITPGAPGDGDGGAPGTGAGLTASEVTSRWDPDTCELDARYPGNVEFFWGCEWSRRMTYGEGAPDRVYISGIADQESVKRTFHPKTAIFLRLALEIGRIWRYQWGAPGQAAQGAGPFIVELE